MGTWGPRATKISWFMVHNGGLWSVLEWLKSKLHQPPWSYIHGDRQPGPPHVMYRPPPPAPEKGFNLRPYYWIKGNQRSNKPWSEGLMTGRGRLTSHEYIFCVSWKRGWNPGFHWKAAVETEDWLNTSFISSCDGYDYPVDSDFPLKNGVILRTLPNIPGLVIRVHNPFHWRVGPWGFLGYTAYILWMSFKVGVFSFRSWDPMFF